MKSVFNPENQSSDVPSKIVIALDRLSEAIRVILWKECKKFKLSPIQIKFLLFLLYQPIQKKTVSFIAQNFTLTKATVSDAIRSLENKNLIYRRKESTDKRISFLLLTQKGKSIAKSLSKFGTEIRESLKGFNNSKKIILFLSLMNIIERLHQKGIISVARMCITCGYFQKKSQFKKNFHCNLKNKPLKENELRIDCYNHYEKTSK